MLKKLIIKGHVFSVFQEEVDLPNGKRVERLIIRHPGASVIIPLTSDGKLVMVRQYRTAVGRELLEFPAGTLEQGEDTLTCAKREIQEEVGFSAAKWQSLGKLFPTPGFCDEFQECFLAQDLSAVATNLDDDEIIQTVQLTPKDLETEIQDCLARGNPFDAKTLAAYQMFRFYSELIN